MSAFARLEGLSRNLIGKVYVRTVDDLKASIKLVHRFRTKRLDYRKCPKLHTFSVFWDVRWRDVRFLHVGHRKNNHRKIKCTKYCINVLMIPVVRTN